MYSYSRHSTYDLRLLFAEGPHNCLHTSHCTGKYRIHSAGTVHITSVSCSLRVHTTVSTHHTVPVCIHSAGTVHLTSVSCSLRVPTTTSLSPYCIALYVCIHTAGTVRTLSSDRLGPPHYLPFILSHHILKHVCRYVQYGLCLHP
jgi:hypothetical protein